MLAKSRVYYVERRNERERFRVQAVNCAFARLRKMVPAIAMRNKRVSKVKTLQKAIEYIQSLIYLLNFDASMQNDDMYISYARNCDDSLF